MITRFDLQIGAPETAITSDTSLLRTKRTIADLSGGSTLMTADAGFSYLGAVNADTVKFTNSGSRVSSLKGSLTSKSSTSLGSSLSVAALRQAYAAQKYKEIQLANDVDFASQIEAHFGVKPKHADDTSYFIGGSSSMIDINPIVNQNLSGDEQANYKASPIGNGSSKIKFTADTYGVVMGIIVVLLFWIMPILVLTELCVRLMLPILLFLKWIVSACSRIIFSKYKPLLLMVLK